MARESTVGEFELVGPASSLELLSWFVRLPNSVASAPSSDEAAANVADQMYDGLWT